MGVKGPELFSNMALSCFHAQQYDMALSLFRRALQASPDDTTAADIWYNQATVALSLGDVSLAYQVRVCVKI
jgi:tetratricopeptide (TPR) repeat protein